jgi:hypothetical protein
MATQGLRSAFERCEGDITATQRDSLIVAGTLVLLLAIFALIDLPYLPNARGGIGGDYSLWLPDLLTGTFWHLKNNVLGLPWFNPGQCGGVPFYADPQIPYLSIPQAAQRYPPPTLPPQPPRQADAEIPPPPIAVPPQPAPRPGLIDIILPNNITVRIDAQFDPAALHRVLEILQSPA